MLTITPIPSFVDNYIWLIHDQMTAVAIDPGSTTHVIPYLARHELTLTDILITHHHFDHIGGATWLAQQTGASIHAPHDDRIPSHHTRAAQETFTLFQNSVPVQVFSTPGHTTTHVCYLLNGESLFCGDVLFSAGCGGHFEGRAEDMFHSLMWIASLHDNVALYPAHEYTLYNLYFARYIEPDNLDVQKMIDDLSKQKTPYCSLPTSVEREKKINPFLRFIYSDCIKCRIEEILKIKINELSEEQIFMVLRQLKSEFHQFHRS